MRATLAMFGLLSLGACQTSNSAIQMTMTPAQSRADEIKSDFRAAGAAMKACSQAPLGKGKYSVLYVHAPPDDTPPSLAQLTDQKKITAAEKALFLELDSELQACRERRNKAVAQVDPRAGKILTEATLEGDAIRADLILRKISWGEFTSRVRRNNATTRQAMGDLGRRMEAELRAEHQHELAQQEAERQRELDRRAAIAAALLGAAQQAQQQQAQQFQQQQLLNAINRPLQTNCNRFGNQTNCTTY